MLFHILMMPFQTLFLWIDIHPSPILVHPPESYLFILKNPSPSRASSDLPLLSLPTPPAFCFDTTSYTFLCWHISCLIDLSICLWVCLLYLRLNYWKQEADLTLYSQILSLILYWSVFHKHLMNESTFSLNPHSEGNCQHCKAAVWFLPCAPCQTQIDRSSISIAVSTSLPTPLCTDPT